MKTRVLGFLVLRALPAPHRPSPALLPLPHLRRPLRSRLRRTIVPQPPENVMRRRNSSSSCCYGRCHCCAWPRCLQLPPTDALPPPLPPSLMARPLEPPSHRRKPRRRLLVILKTQPLPPALATSSLGLPPTDSPLTPDPTATSLGRCRPLSSEKTDTNTCG